MKDNWKKLEPIQLRIIKSPIGIYGHRITKILPKFIKSEYYVCSICKILGKPNQVIVRAKVNINGKEEAVMIRMSREKYGSLLNKNKEKK